MKMSFGCAVLAAALLFGSLGAAIAGAPTARPDPAKSLTLTLRDSVTLDRPAMLLGDLVDVAPGPAVPDLMALPLGQAPRVGHLLRLRRAELEVQLRRYGVLPQIAWEGAQAVLVATRAQRLDPHVLRQSALTHLAQVYPEPTDSFEIALPESAVEIPQRPYQLRARAIGSQAGPRVLVWLDVVVDGAIYRSVVMPASVVRTRTGWVARRPVAGGSRVHSADFEERQINAAGLGPLPALGDLAGTRLRSTLREGQVLTMQSIAPAGTVFRGDPVRLTVQSGALEIEAPGVAQANALPGQVVAVRSASSGEILSGRLNRTGDVVIE